METVTDFIFLGSPKSLWKVTAGMKLKYACSLKRKVMTTLDRVIKSRDITLPTNVHIVKAMVFTVVMYECKSWIIKKDECWRIDAFKLWCWRRLLRVPWTARRSTQSNLKEINPEYSLEGLILSWSSNILASCCEELTHWKRPWCREGLNAGEGDDRDHALIGWYHRFNGH